MEKPTVLLDEAKKLAQTLEAFYKRLQAEPGEVVDAAVVSVLAPHLCRLTKMCIPNAHQKIDEIIYADEHKHLKVQEQQHGADLKTAEGACYELKTSICTARAPKVNFNWPVPADRGDPGQRRAKLLASINAKTKDGGAVLRIVDGKNKLLKEYHFCNAYLLGYFSRLQLGKSTNHNMGCAQCASCKSFHRLDRMMYVDRQIRLAGEDAGYFTMVDWNNVMYMPKCPMDRPAKQ